MTTVKITSFGYLHGRPPAVGLTVDLREGYRDPHAVDGLRELTAADPRVAAAVMATPGIPALVRAIAAAVRDLLDGSSLVTVAVGCAGGRHRSAVVAGRVACLLEADGIAAAVEHRDIGKPVVARAGGGRPLCAYRSVDGEDLTFFDVRDDPRDFPDAELIEIAREIEEG